MTICKRCGRWFKAKPGQEYGPTCKAKMRNRISVIEVRDRKGDLRTVIV